jgi:hypothetical protein
MGMAIHRLFREAPFGPDDIARMTAAYDAALTILRLVNLNDPITELIADKIIEVVRNGERDPPRICARALKELGVVIPD